MNRIGGCGAGLHFDRNAHPVDRDDEVELTTTDTPVAAEDLGTTVGEKPSGDVLAKGPECFAPCVGV